jgi:hypothetical protein
MLTSDECDAIEQKMADLTTRMVALDHLNTTENIPAWADLYDEREALDRQLIVPIRPTGLGSRPFKA